MTNTIEQLAAIAQVRAAFANRIDAIEAQLASEPLGWVFCWERYALGVRINDDGKFAVVSIENATPVTSNNTRVFTNGGRERAVLMTRKWALECALRSQTVSLAHFEADLAKQEA